MLVVKIVIIIIVRQGLATIIKKVNQNKRNMLPTYLYK